MRHFKFIFLIFLFAINLNAQNGWYRITPGSSVWYYGVQFTSNSTGYVIGSNGSIIKTKNAGFNFSTLSSTVTAQLEDIFFVNQSTGYVVGSGGIILKTTNEGNSWVIQYPGGGWTLFSVHFTDADFGCAVGASGTIRTTTNGGQTWGYQSSNTTLNLTSVFFTSRDTGYIGGLGGNQTLLKTTNRGLNWINMSTPGPYSALIRGIWFVNSDTGFGAGSLGKIYKTSNSGENWIEIQAGSSMMNLDDLCFADQNTGFFISQGGILLTTNSGLSWITQHIDFDPFVYAVNFINAYTGYIVGENGGIWKTTTGGGQFVGLENTNNTSPGEYKLYQNYPNPFNQTSIINFQCSFNGIVKIVIYNIAGREVKTLMNEYKEAGYYTVKFDGDELASGIYIYKMTSDYYTETRKMLMIK